MKQMSNNQIRAFHPVTLAINPYALFDTPNAIAPTVIWGIVAKREDSYLLLWEGCYFLCWAYGDLVNPASCEYLTWLLSPKSLKKVRVGTEEVVVWWRDFSDLRMTSSYWVRYREGQLLGDVRFGAES
jgi:hypothetical protein